jgi:two-component system, cell cycle response regulator DivK
VKARILVVEDNATNRDLISYLLRAFGYEVACENDGGSGLANALAGNYDLVLADVLMPNMDGFEFARRFKSDPRLAHTPLIAVTALAMSGDKEKILRAGFDGYISKPIDPQQFSRQIAAFLNGDSHG